MLLTNLGSVNLLVLTLIAKVVLSFVIAYCLIKIYLE